MMLNPSTFPSQGWGTWQRLPLRTFQLLQPTIGIITSLFPVRVGMSAVGILFLFHYRILRVGGETLSFQLKSFQNSEQEEPHLELTQIPRYPCPLCCHRGIRHLGTLGETWCVREACEKDGGWTGVLVLHPVLYPSALEFYLTQSCRFPHGRGQCFTTSILKAGRVTSFGHCKGKPWQMLAIFYGITLAFHCAWRGAYPGNKCPFNQD